MDGVLDIHLCSGGHLCGQCNEVKAGICRKHACMQAREMQDHSAAVAGGTFERRGAGAGESEECQSSAPAPVSNAPSSKSHYCY